MIVDVEQQVMANGTILRTRNGGPTWTSQASEAGNWIFGVSFTGGNTGTVAGDNGTILRTTTGGVTWVSEYQSPGIRRPEHFARAQNYPNPFNPSTTIRYGLPSRSHVNLAVFNTLGQQVAILQNGEQETGYHEVKFNASGLASGVYFYRLQARHTDGGQAGTYEQTGKLLLLR